MEYILHKKFLNRDFVPTKIADAKKIDIQEDELHPFIRLIGKDGIPFMQIPLENVIDTSILTQLYSREMLIQIVYREATERLRIIRLNIVNSEINEVYNKLHRLRQKKGNDTNMPRLNVCSQCGSNCSLNSKFCAVCGHKLEIACQQCGNLNSQEWLFCPNCALRLKN